MPSLFSLFVDLKANTADFVSGMSTASYAAKKAGRDIEDSFSSLGSIASAALAPFGALGSEIGETLSKIGEYAERASEQFAHLGSGMSKAAVAAGVLAGTMAAVGGSAIAIALETAKSADELFHLAESSGVSVEALSKLSFVAKQYDIDQQTLTKGLQMMSVQMEKAATAGPNVVTVFDRMGLSVRNSNGTLKDASEMFTEIIGKLQQMQDRTAAVGLSREIFGRQTGGAVLRIPGTEAIDKWSAEAQKLNLVIDEQTALAAHHFEESLHIIEGAAQGVSLQLEEAMLPAMQAVADGLTQVAESSSKASGPVAGIADSFKYFLQIADFVYTELELITSWLAKTAVAWEVFGEGASAAAAKASHLDFSGASAAWKDTFAQLNAIQTDYLNRGKENWKNYQDFVGTLFSKPGATKSDEAPKSPVGEANLAPRTEIGIPPKDTVADLVSNLGQDAAAELGLASAIQQTVAAMTLAKAAGEADVKIQQERNQLLDQEKTLRAELANAIKEQIPGDVEKYQQEIAVVQRYLRELDADAPLIQQRYAEIAAAKLFASTGEDLAKQGSKYDTETASLNEQSAAYKQGGSAIAGADIGKELEPARQKVSDLAEAYARFAAEHPFDLPAIATFAEGLANARAQLQKLTSDALALKSAEIEVEIQKQTRAFEDQVPSLTQLANAYLQSADAVREAQVQLKVAEYKSANPAASADQIQKMAALYQQQSDVAYSSSIAQEAAHYNLSEQYSDEIEKLSQIREALQGVGADTIAVDAAIYDANEKNVEQWDELALKVGSVGDKYQAFLNQIAIEGQNPGEKMFGSLSKAADDFETQLADLAVTGKANFRSLFDSLAEQAFKTQFQSILAKAVGPPRTPESGPNAPGGTAGIVPGPLGLSSSLAHILGVKPSNGAAAPDGSQSNPYYTVPMDDQGNVLGDETGQTVGSTSLIGSLFSPKSQTPGEIGPGNTWSGLIGQLANSQNAPDGTIGANNTWSGVIGDDQSATSSGSGLGSIARSLENGAGSILSTIGGTIGGVGKSITSIA